jgi:nitrite reductase/ring-hydroxylating ferredoxin subunit
MSHSTTTTAPPHRRNVLQWLSLALGGLAALLAGIPIIGYVVGALVRTRKDAWIVLGPVSKFPVNQTLLVTFDNPLRQPWDGMTAATAAYVRHLGHDQFEVFAVNCAHLGCPVSWFPQSGLFMCPCHGGVYYKDGSYASGPPPRGLFKYPCEVEKGVLKIKGAHLPTLQDTLRHPQEV